MRGFCLIFIFYAYGTFAFADEISEEKELAHSEVVTFRREMPNYFLVGTPQTKVQISFKARVIRSQEVYFAYTQRMFWDLFKKSSPFRDVNYAPSVFRRFHVGAQADALFDIIAYEHESNGKDGEDSRAWNRSGVRYQFAEKWGDQIRAEWSFKAWIPYRMDPRNPDYVDYRGLYDITLSLFNLFGDAFDVDDVSLRIYGGGASKVNPLQGGQELTLRFKPQSFSILANAVVQVFQGYGESMLEYKKRVFGLRIGFGI